MRQFFLSLLVAVLVVGGGGAINYYRNAPLDAELEDRQFERYADADLEALLAAHKMERDRIRKALSKKSNDPTSVMNGFAAADFHGRLNAFDKFQVRNSAYKRVNAVALEHEVEIEALEWEQGIRARGLDDPKQRVWRRITTF